MGVRCYINNKPRELIAARVEKNGTRAIDSSTFTFSRSVAITKGDSITYLQDPTNIKYLVGVWNFFGFKDVTTRIFHGVRQEPQEELRAAYLKEARELAINQFSE